MAAVVVVTVLSAGRPAPARADPLPEFSRLTVDPTCAPTPSPDGDLVSLTVRGYSFESGRIATVWWDGNPAPAPADAIQIQASGYLEVTIQVPLQGTDVSFHTLDAYYQDQQPTDSTQVPPVASTSVTVPCAEDQSHIVVTPDCGPAATPLSIHVDGTGFLPELPIDVVVVSGENVYGQLAPSVPADPNAVALDVQATLPGNGVYQVIATQRNDLPGEIFNRTPRVASAYFVVPCSQSTLSPNCGPSGSGPDRYSIQVSGAGFLPGLPVTIIFDATGQAEFFSGQFATNTDGSWGPAEIRPYARGPGAYDVVVEQSNDGPVLHRTHAVFTVECPQPGNVSLNPTCTAPQFAGDEPRAFELVVSAQAGFQPGLPVTLTFDPDALSGPNFTPETVPATADANGGFSATLTVAARPAGTYRVAVQQQVNGAILEGVVPAFNVPCSKPNPRISVKPKCGNDATADPTPYSLAITGRGFIPGFVQLLFNGTPQAGPVFANANGRFEATIAPDAVTAGTYTIVATQADERQTLDEAQADFVVPCTDTPTPTLTIEPDSAAPGFVVQVTGTGFPAGQAVELRWSVGIGAGTPIEVLTSTDGTFDKQVLIFAHDFVGPREMTAGTAANPDIFPDATASLLVSAGQGSPPAYSVFGGAPTDQPPIILRR